jgi:hypothetical protein
VLLKNVRVYALALSFSLTRLQSLALDKFQLQLTVDWSGGSFFDCIKEVYAMVDSNALRVAVVQTAVAHFHELATKASFVNLLREGGDFACDCCTRIHQQYSIATWKLR